MTEPDFELLRDDFASRFVDQAPAAVRPMLREACALYEEARTLFERLDAEAGRAWSETMRADMRRFARALEGSTRFDYSRPGELDLAALRLDAEAPAEWSDAVLLAGVALVAARYAAECADDAAELERYVGAAREALALVDALDSEARLAAEAPNIATGAAVRAKNRAAAERRARDLRAQGDATREAVKAARLALGVKATAGAIARRVGISRQRVVQILAELDRKN